MHKAKRNKLLRRYLYENCVTRVEFGQMIGRSPTYINERINGISGKDGIKAFDTTDIIKAAVGLGIPQDEWVEVFFENSRS